MKKAEVKTPTFNTDSNKGKVKEITFKISLWLFVLIFMYLLIFK